MRPSCERPLEKRGARIPGRIGSPGGGRGAGEPVEDAQPRERRVRGPEIPEGLDGRRQALGRRLAPGEKRNFLAGNGVEDSAVELFLAPEVIVESRHVHAGPGGHLPRRRAREARRGEALFRGVENGAPRPGDIAAAGPSDVSPLHTAAPPRKFSSGPRVGRAGSVGPASPLCMLPSGRVPARKPPPVSIRPAGPGETVPDPDLLHARATDPEGALVAVDQEGRIVGSAQAAVREDALLLLALSVTAGCRGKGVGGALLAAARAYGATRGARALEVLAPHDPSSLAFFFRAGLSLRTVVLEMAAELPALASEPGTVLQAISPGPSLYGWIAALDRETRGFARPRDWARWAEEGRAVSWKRAGRPVALGAWHPGPRGTALGPIAARAPEGAADLLPLLAARAGGRRFTLALPSEARALLRTATSLGFRPVSTHVLLGERRRGDLRRYAGGGGLIF